MGALSVLTQSIQDFSSDADVVGARLTLRLRGTADMRARPLLEDVLQRLHGEVRRLRVGEVAVDFAGLEFMNSSCFKSFVTWLSQIDELRGESRYRVSFLSNPNHYWQRRSLHALQSYARDVVAVVATGPLP